MKQDLRLYSFYRNKKKAQGFALAEIVVALFFVTLVTFLIGALAQQVMKFSKKSRQISAVIELRTKTAGMMRDPDGWLAKMRAMTVPAAAGDPAAIAFNSCLPAANDPSAKSFTCPDENLSIPYEDLAPDLQKITLDGKFKVMETPIRDSMGTYIAGTTNNRVFLSNDGVECKSSPKETTCPLQSIGYFLRENAGVNLDPGNVKFVVKVEMNPAVAHNVTPMRPQYMTMDIGTSYSRVATNSCEDGLVFTGIQTDGSARCEDAHNPCTGGKVQVGYVAGGPVCEDPVAVAATCDTAKGEKVILDPVAKKLICAKGSPCQTVGTFTGFYSGSGEPMCSTSCGSGTVQMGMTGNTAACKTVAPCDPLTQSLTYDGDSFSCVDGRSIASTDGNDGGNGNDGTAGLNGSVVLPPECKAGMAISVNSSGTGFTCVAPPKPPIIPPTPLCITNPAACPVDDACENGTLGNDLKRVFIKSTDWKWDPSSVCDDGYVLQNSAGAYTVRTFDERPSAASLPIDLKFATYREPDGLRIVAEGTYGRKVLFSTCQLSTDNEGGGHYGLKKPPNVTIRSFSIQVPEGTLRLKVDRKNNDSPSYVSLRGFCKTFKEQSLKPQSGAKTGSKVRNEFQADVEGYGKN